VNVLVVGGYGAVGAAATRELATRLPGRVVVAGRDVERARTLAASVGAGAARVDVADVAGFERVLADERISAVVLCVEPPDARIARACLARGVHVVDVGASWPLLREVEGLVDLAVDHAATAVFGLRRVLRPVARHPRAARLLAGGFGGVHLGGDRFAVRVDALRGGRRATRVLSGREQSRVTGLVAAHVTARLLDGGLPPGVHHVDELSEFAGIPDALRSAGVSSRA
jgi:hypothetical protein